MHRGSRRAGLTRTHRDMTLQFIFIPWSGHDFEKCVKFDDERSDHSTMPMNRRVATVAVLATCTFAAQAVSSGAVFASAPRHTSRVAPASPAKPSTYTIVAGDYLIGIAGKLKVTLGALLAANNFTVDSLILPGQRIVVPAGGVVPLATATRVAGATPGANGAATKSPTTPAAESNAGATTYTVVAGDYLIGIARMHQVSFASLLAANSFTAASFIYPGSKVSIPAGGITPAPAPTLKSTNAAMPAPAPVLPSNTLPTVSTGNAQVDTVVNFALGQVGKRYVFFTAGPDTYDCSGLVKAAYAQIGRTLIHQSAVQATYGRAIDWKTEPIKPGDLVFTWGSGSPKGVIGHVGIAVSGSKWVHAYSPSAPVTYTWLPAPDSIVAVRRLIDG